MKEHKIKDEGNLPEVLCDSHDPGLPAEDRHAVCMAGAHRDASISSTVNVPNSFTVEETERLYLYAYERGLKGITIFRDGCKRVGDFKHG